MQQGNIPFVQNLAHPFGLRAIAACALVLALAQDAVASRNPFLPPQVQEAMPEAPGMQVRSQEVLVEQYRKQIERHVERQSSLVGIIDSNQRMYLEPLAGCYFKSAVSGFVPSICTEHIMRHVYVHQDGRIEYPRMSGTTASEGASSFVAPELVEIIADTQTMRFVDASCESAFDSITHLSEAYPGRVINFTSEKDATEEGFVRVDQSEC